MPKVKQPPPQSVWDIPRNDVAACVAYYKSRGAVSGEELSVMLKLQDDDTELLELAQAWKTSGPPGM
jgi:hypothetical protein